jgi:hypothetical protein
MHSTLKYMEDHVDNNSLEKFSTVEYEKFKRVVDYMESSIYPLEKLREGRRDFYNWFNTLDTRRETDLLSWFPEMENFYKLCEEENETRLK